MAPAAFTGWPPGMRIIARRERPHPGAQLRITDHEGWRITCSPPTLAAHDWPTWNYATGCAHAPRPHPRAQGHRDDQPATAGIRQERDLA